MSTTTNFFTTDFLKKNVPFFNNIEETATKTESTPYIVGGCVRDMIRSRTICDVDIVPFDCGYESFAKILAKNLHASAIPFKDNFRIMKNRIIIDVSKPRGENIWQDLMLRDFTINNLAVSLDGAITGDRSDIDNKIIRHVYYNAFDDDPLRLFRAFRFRSSLGFSISGDTIELINEKIAVATLPAKERVLEEMKKTFGGPYFKEILSCQTFLKLMGSLDTACSISPENALRAKELEDDADNIFPIFLALFFQGETTAVEKFFKNLKLSAKEMNILSFLLKIETKIDFTKLEDPLERQKTAWRFYDQLKNIIVFLKCKYPRYDKILDELGASAQNIHMEKCDAINGNDLKQMGLSPSPLFSQILYDAREKLALCLVDPEDIKDYIKKKYKI